VRRSAAVEAAKFADEIRRDADEERAYARREMARRAFLRLVERGVLAGRLRGMTCLHGALCDSWWCL
jgi:hypothetical protein